MNPARARAHWARAWTLLLLLSHALGLARGESNIRLGAALGWSPNLGWWNWASQGDYGARIDAFVCSAFIYSANVGWIHLGNGTPANGIYYGNATASDYGVNVDSHGRLRGLAYGANIGWIQFADAGQPRLHLRTGRLSGWIYGANVGWIALDTPEAPLALDFLAEGRDTDNDTIPDAWEIYYTNGLAELSDASDVDHDGQTDVEEYWADTDPTDPTDYLRITALKVDPTRTWLTVTWTARPTRYYQLQSADHLDASAIWRSTDNFELEASSFTLTHEIPVPEGDAMRAFRVKAVRPLAP